MACLDGRLGAARPWVHRTDKPIPVPGQRLDVVGILRVVAQCLAESQDRRVDAVLEVDKGVDGPEFLLEFFPRHHFPGMFEECSENLEGPFTKLYLFAVAPKFARPNINLEVGEANVSIADCRCSHGEVT